MIQLRVLLRNGRAIRLIIAFLLGLPLGAIAGKFGIDLQNVVPFILFPVLVGAISGLMVSMRQPHPHLLALGTGLLAWGGVGVSLLVMTAQAALTPCTSGGCASTTSNILSSLLIFYLLAGLILVSLATLTTSILMRRFRQGR